MKGYILDLESAGGNRLKILVKGPDKALVWDELDPYFYLAPDSIRSAEKELLSKFGDKIKKIDIVEKGGKKVLRIESHTPSQAIELRHSAKELGETLEHEINYAYRYLIDKGLYASRYYDFETDDGQITKIRRLRIDP